ncbi:MAG: TIGR02594 family protein [Thermoflexales bacterium]
MTQSEPRWLQIARSYIGVKEVPGPRHNSTIVSWLVSLRAWWRDDETPWCGVFVAHCLREAGITDLPEYWMRALAWAPWGANLRASHVAPGAILVFSRQGGGHVGFYVGEDASFYHVLGGNQRNMVNIMKIAKARCVAIRWPKGEPVVGGPVFLTGGEVSTNEA